MASRVASPSKPAVTAASATASKSASSPTAVNAGSPTAHSPLLASGLAPRPFTHAPYISTGNIINSDELEAVELGVYAGGADGRRSAPGSPAMMGSFNASHNSANTMHGSHGFSTGKKNICRHFVSGNCNRGSSCRFYHPGSIHRVITPTHPRTPTQRPLTPLADLAQQNIGFANASPVQSPHTDAFAAASAPCAPRPTLLASAIAVSSSRSGADTFGSPLGSPSTSLQRGAGFGEAPAATASTTPALTSPSSGPQFSPGTSLASRARRGPGLNPLPALQLPDCMHGGGSDDGTHEGGSNAAASAERSAAVAVPHSPASPGPYRMPVYRCSARPSSSALNGRTESTDGIPSPSVPQSPPQVNFGVAAAAEGATSPSAVGTTRNNPYAYSPTGVARTLGPPMSPLNRAPNGH